MHGQKIIILFWCNTFEVAAGGVHEVINIYKDNMYSKLKDNNNVCMNKINPK